MPEYRITVTGALPEGVSGEIVRRFGPVQVAQLAQGTSLQVGAFDQAALRAVLELLWDVGAQVSSVCLVHPNPGESPPGVVLPNPDTEEVVLDGAPGLKKRRNIS